MAKEKKKFKNIKLEQDELKPTTIGMFESRKRSSIGTFIILSIFVLVVIFLPQISDYVNTYLNPVVTPVAPTPTPPPTPTPGEDEDGDDDDLFHAYTAELAITNDDITVSAFNVDVLNNTITYTITNNSNNQDIEELNYYIEIYNTERTLIERVKLVSELTLASGAFREITKNISSDSANTIGYIVLIKKTTLEYPEVTIGALQDGTGTMVCSKDHEEVTYKFDSNKLQSLTSIVTYNNTDLDYDSIYSSIKVSVDTYNNKTGVTSTMVGDTNAASFNVITNVNLSEASRLYIFNADSFKIDTMPKVVKFEMEAQGFKCE